MNSESLNILELQNENLRFSFCPAVGGSVIGFAAKHAGCWVPLMRISAPDVKRSSDMASFLMLPYPNRIAQACFDFDGASYQLGNKEKHAIHGYVRDRNWKVANHNTTSASMSFDSREFAEIEYPFPFAAELSYQIQNTKLITTVSLTNTGKTRMPAGCGFHPYFRRRLTDETENVELQFRVSGVYPTDANIPLPTAGPLSLSAEHDFSTLRPLTVDLDHCFSGWDGKAIIRWPKSGIELQMQADKSLSHLVIYSPAGKDFFALEPQSQMIDGFNFLARGFKESGVQILNPGQTKISTFILQVEIKEPPSATTLSSA